MVAVYGTALTSKFSLVHQDQAPLLDALVRVCGGCFLVGKGWIAAPGVQETIPIGMLPAPMRVATRLPPYRCTPHCRASTLESEQVCA
jgi:hypothetical protein